ncbi:small ribosomal subunit protein mS31-like isoform X2 [Artemia franciscana]|uniref:small ribosomal subunit protein mS31-like isoform X2 n=1 Tax=Artemia franciscana TaxID=6661 RepID=UPI0032D9D0EB
MKVQISYNLFQRSVLLKYKGSSCGFHQSTILRTDSEGKQNSKGKENSTGSQRDKVSAAKTKSKTDRANIKKEAAVPHSAKLEAAQKRLQALLKEFPQEETIETKINLVRPKSKLQKKKADKISAIEAAAKGVADVLKGSNEKDAVKQELLARVQVAERGLPAYDKEELLGAITGLKARVRQEEENKRKAEEAIKAKEVEKAAAVKQKFGEKKGDEGKKFERRAGAYQAGKTRLFEAEPLGIFIDSQGKPILTPSGLKSGMATWDAAKERALQMCVLSLPANGFEEMIQWTEQGKLWKFPIDNEYGLEEEHNVGFHEHIFLEPHLEPWCPKSGPVRHFMELVCVGLSKNPWLTIEEKKRHILWFKDYFTEKIDLLKETHAVDEAAADQLTKPLEIEQ